MDILELEKDFRNFCKLVNEAINEQNIRGKVSEERKIEVSNSFTDAYSKYTKISLGSNEHIFELLLALIGKMCMYNYKTGNTFDLEKGLIKIIQEKINKEIPKIVEK